MLMVFMMIIRIMTMVMVVIDMMVMDITITTAAPISMLRCSHQSMIKSPHMYRYVLSPNTLLESTLESGGGADGRKTLNCLVDGNFGEIWGRCLRGGVHF